MTITRWRDVDWLVLAWRDGSSRLRVSLPFRFDSICRHLRDRERFVPEALNLPPLISEWLDKSVEAGLQAHIINAENPEEAIKFEFPSYISPKFPITPQIDREGRAFSSLQLPLLQSLIELRRRLVDQSEHLFRGSDWLRDLFSFLSTAVAAVDNTLHQLYYRAQHEAATHGWTFNAESLGPRHGQRIRDKLAWIGKITGRPLDTCPAEVESFIRIKNVRNHVAHFDPPVLAFTIEDVAAWLNLTRDLATVLAEMRYLCGEPICGPLVELLLARNVLIVPSNPHQKRTAQPPDVGYASSCSPESSEGEMPPA